MTDRDDTFSGSGEMTVLTNTRAATASHRNWAAISSAHPLTPIARFSIVMRDPDNVDRVVFNEVDQ
jgi:hypothetical protein